MIWKYAMAVAANTVSVWLGGMFITLDVDWVEHVDNGARVAALIVWVVLVSWACSYIADHYQR